MQQIQLNIPEPCHEDWQNMTPTDQGRFCNACAKQVVDFSTMTDTQVLNYFANIKNENVCGRAYPDQLDRMITMPKEPKKRLFWHWNYITMLFLFFSKTNNAKAQGGMKVQTVSRVNTKPQRIVLGGISSSPIGKEPLYVIDGTPFPQGLPATFNYVDIDNISILKTKEAAAIYGPEAAAGAIVITTKKPVYKKLDTVVVKSYPTQGAMRRTCVSGGVSSKITIKRTITDSIRSVFTKITGDLKIYPSPVQKGNSITITLKLKQAGDLNIQVINAGGLIVLQKQSSAIAKQYIEQVQTGRAWSSGVYYVRIFDSNNKMISTSNFLIQ